MDEKTILQALIAAKDELEWIKKHSKYSDCPYDPKDTLELIYDALEQCEVKTK